jgi:hypothetical protein
MEFPFTAEFNMKHVLFYYTATSSSEQLKQPVDGHILLSPSFQRFFNSWVGIRFNPLGTSPIRGPTELVPDNYECEAVDRMRTGKGNRSTRKRPATVPLCPLKIPHDLKWDRIQAAAVGSPVTNCQRSSALGISSFSSNYAQL